MNRFLRNRLWLSSYRGQSAKPRIFQKSKIRPTVELLEDRLAPAGVTVTTTQDLVDGTTTSIPALIANPGNDGKISLREAVLASNASGGAGTIDFDLGAGTHTITLGGTHLEITSDITINGLGADILTIDGDDQSRIFHVSSASNLDISGVTLDNGNAGTGAQDNGGAILSDGGNLIFTDSAVTNSSAGGIGGGIANEAGNFTVTRSTISNNVSRTGAGLYNRGGILNLANSTVSTNTTNGNGGGGGLVTNDSGNTTITNATITLNSAGGSIGGGMVNDPGTSVSIKNSIVAGNTGSTPNIVGGFVNLGNNFIDGNPMLGPLADNGGPTKTHAPASGSAAIDAGNNTGSPATDQRGFIRIADGDNNGTAIVDIGAFEVQSTSPTVTVTATPVAAAEDGGGNLVYTFTRTGSTAQPLTVNFNVSGTAAFSSDYSQSGAASFDATSGTVTFSAGFSTAEITIGPTTDTTVEADETVILTIAASGNYEIGNPDSAAGTITNDDTASLTVMNVTAEETNTGTTTFAFDVKLNNDVQGGLTVAVDT